MCGMGSVERHGECRKIVGCGGRVCGAYGACDLEISGCIACTAELEGCVLTGEMGWWGVVCRGWLGVDWLAACDVDLSGMGKFVKRVPSRQLSWKDACRRVTNRARAEQECRNCRECVRVVRRVVAVGIVAPTELVVQMFRLVLVCREGGLGVGWLATIGVELCGLGSGKRHLQDRKLVAARQCVCTYYGDEQDEDRAGVEELQREGAWWVWVVHREDGWRVEYFAAFEVDLRGMGLVERYVEDRRLVGMGAVPDCGIAPRQWVCMHHGDEEDEDRAGMEELQRGGGRGKARLVAVQEVRQALAVYRELSWVGADGLYEGDVVGVGSAQRRRLGGRIVGCV
ncbi:uncharacterized protein EMH_0082220 [Eimeria mitis]|uniref:Uncharacterized protein n=1 Tax=Eimeria mitis TaxID=44415 RepID=U6K622_9EIME|nr:uncharacterized protein EMH_0082220 [Eimeria mitis]CDJ33384.1 hypothetical protein EMH_0082220 [Eimeria mitis]